MEDRCAREERSQERCSPLAPRLVIEVCVLPPHAALVGGVGGRIGRQHRQVCVDEHGLVGPHGLVAGGHQHEPADRGDPCRLHAEPGQVALGKARAGRLVAGGRRVVDRVVEPPRQAHRARIRHGHWHHQLVDRAQQAEEVDEPVVMAMGLAVASQQAVAGGGRGPPDPGDLGPAVAQLGLHGAMMAA